MGECEKCECWQDTCLERFLGFCTKYAGEKCPFEKGVYDGDESHKELYESLQQQTSEAQEKEEDIQGIDDEEESRDRYLNKTYHHIPENEIVQAARGEGSAADKDTAEGGVLQGIESKDKGLPVKFKKRLRS